MAGISRREIAYRVKAVERNGNNQVSYSNLAWASPAPRIFIPSAFTPNGDSENERFLVNRGEWPMWAKTYQITIFDRWGRVIFEANNIGYDVSWDGTFANQGTLVPEGVYVYTVQMSSITGELEKISGTVTLLR